MFYLSVINPSLLAGEIVPVAGTENDFLTPRRLADVVGEARGGEGYCVNFCVGDGAGKLR